MRKSALTGLVLVASMMIGCGQNPKVAIYNNDARIASDGNSYNFYADVDQDWEDSSYTATVNGMDGMDTVWSCNADDDSIVEIDFDMGLSTGAAKLVFIDPDGKLETIVECSSEGAETGSKAVKIKKGNNRIKLVCRDKAELDMALSIDTGAFEKLGF